MSTYNELIKLCKNLLKLLKLICTLAEKQLSILQRRNYLI